jgi:hypothetical protein
VIKGTVEVSQTYFRTHRSSKGTLKYIVPGFTVGASYTLTMGFAEIWKPNCAKGMRILSIKLNDVIVTSKLDVFGKVGCETAYLESHVATPNANGQFVIEVISFAENPMISYISISLAPGQYFLDAGAVGDDISMVTGKVSPYGNADSPVIDRTDLNQVPFRTNRFGADFKYVIDSGFTRGKAYKVALGFSEISPTACTAGKRKFSIAINGQTVENGLDVAGTTGGCNKALVKLYTITANAQGKFEIGFKGIVNNAMISSIAIKP